MKITQKSSLMLGMSVFALVALSACGGETTPAETDDTSQLAQTSAVPTVTPNADPLNSAHPNSIQPETTISLSAEGSVKREPDLAYLNAGVQTQGETAQAAMSANAAAMNGVFEALEAANIEASDLQT